MRLRTCSIPASAAGQRAWVPAPGYSHRRTIRGTVGAIFPRHTRRAGLRRRNSTRLPQRDYTASPITGLDPQLEKELGLGDEASPGPAPEKSDPKYRLPRADLPTQPGGFGRHREPAIARTAAARGPPGIFRGAMDPAPAAAAGEIRRRQALRHRVGLRAEGRPAAGDQGAGRRGQAQRPHAGAARRHRLGQDLYNGEGDRGDAAPCPHPRAQQDVGRAALRRVQVVLP